MSGAVTVNYSGVGRCFQVILPEVHALLWRKRTPDFDCFAMDFHASKDVLGLDFVDSSF